MPVETTSARGTQALRAENRRQITDLLRTQGPLARADIASRSGLARSAVTAIVQDLIDDGILCEDPGGSADRRSEQPSRGRPKVLVGLDPSAARVAAIQIGARWARIVLADAAGQTVASEVADTVGASADEVIDRLATLVAAMVAAHPGPPLTNAGVCVPGAVDTTDGTVLRSDVLGWIDVPLASLLAARLGTPVYVQDVTQAATLAEARFGAAAGARSALVVDYGARIGIGLVVDGQLHRGASGLAGSIGHTATFEDDTPCRCGRAGCLEAIAGVRAMVPVGDAEAFADVIARLRSGDPEATAVVHRSLDRGAHLVATLIALLDPEVVVLTGMVVDYPDLADDLTACIEAALPPEHLPGLDLRRSDLGLQAWVRGAVLVALQQLQPEVRGALRSEAARVR